MEYTVQHTGLRCQNFFFVRDEVLGQDETTSSLPLSHRQVDPVNFDRSAVMNNLAETRQNMRNAEADDYRYQDAKVFENGHVAARYGDALLRTVAGSQRILNSCREFGGSFLHVSRVDGPHLAIDH